MHQSYIFFLSDEGGIRRICSSAYVAVVRGETAMKEYAGRRLRVADWYVALRENTPFKVENETYSYLYFDTEGHADPRNGNFSLEQNRSFYRAAFSSSYSNIDCDPKVQQVREEAGDEFSWLPTEEERKMLYSLIFKNGQFRTGTGSGETC